MPEFYVLRLPAIYDFRAIQVGDHSMGPKKAFAEFTANTGNFLQRAVVRTLIGGSYAHRPALGTFGALLRSAMRIMPDPAVYGRALIGEHRSAKGATSAARAKPKGRAIGPYEPLRSAGLCGK